MAITGFSQIGVFESNMTIESKWDYEKEEYVSIGDVNTDVNWKLYYDSKSTKTIVLVVNNIVKAAETIICSDKYGKNHYFDGIKGTRVMYVKEDDVFLVYIDKNSYGRYETMYLFYGYHKKISKKNFKSEIGGYEVEVVNGDDAIRQI